MSCALWLAETISRHFFNQSHVTSKSVVTWSHASSRAYQQLHLLWVLIGSPKEGHPPLPLPGSTLGKSAFRNSAQRSDTTINYRTKKGKNKQNIAVLAWPKNTLFSSTVKYWTPLTTINVQFQHCWALHIPYLLHISCHSRLWHQHHCDLKTLEQTAPTRSWTGQNVPRFPVETRHHCHRRCKGTDLKHQLRHPSGKCSCRLE